MAEKGDPPRRKKRVGLLIIISSLLMSCFYVPEFPVVQSGLSAKKQKQRIAVLQKKLESAEKEHKKVQIEVEKLASEIHEAQLALIRRQIDEAERKKTASLFLEEREALYEMIQSGPSPAAFEAQVELDRILRIITELSDERKNV